MTGIEIGSHVDATNVEVDQNVNILNPGNFDNKEFDSNFFKHEKVNNIFFEDSSD
jgi:hypothetical protein